MEEVYKLQVQTVGIQTTLGIGKMQNKFPGNDKFPILSCIVFIILVRMMWISSTKVIFVQVQL